MNYEEKYKQALERAKGLLEDMNKKEYFASNVDIENIFPELQENEDERIRKGLIKAVSGVLKGNTLYGTDVTREEALVWLEKQGEPEDKGEISDGCHTFNELYEYRKLYNAAFFNLLPKGLVHKSKKHHDGEECFGGGWFIVMANLPTGQISNHYELKDWDLFQIPEKDVADEWDGHTPQDAADRLHEYLLEKQGEKDPCTNCINDKDCVTCENGNMKETEVTPKFKVGDWIVGNDGTFKITQYEDEYGYELTDTTGCVVHFISPNYVESNFHLWTIEDAKDGDVLTNGESIVIFKQIVEPKYRQYIEAYIGLDWGCNIQVTSESWSLGIDKTMPATKEQRALLFQKMKEEGYEWDADKKELKKIEPKKLNPDEVIAWLVANICDFEYYVKLFKKDFGL